MGREEVIVYGVEHKGVRVEGQDAAVLGEGECVELGQAVAPS